MGLMRYLTREWATGGLSGEEHEARIDANLRALNDVWPLFPESLVEFFYGEPYGGFHDARLLAWHEDGSDLVMEFSTGDLQKGYWSVRCVFSDGRARTTGQDLATMVNDKIELLYSEYARVGDRWAWRTLCWPDTELEVTFTDVSTSWSPRRGR